MLLRRSRLGRFELDAAYGLFDSTDRRAYHAHRCAEVERHLGFDMRIQRIGCGDIDRSCEGIEPRWKRTKPSAHGARKLLHELLRALNMAQSWANIASDLLIELRFANGAAIDKRARKRDAPHDRQEQRSLHLFPRNQVRRDEAPPQLDRHDAGR